MYVDSFVIGVLVYIFVGLWLGLGKASPLRDLTNDYPGWYTVLFMFVGPGLIGLLF